jgi:hypothetical protein
LVSIAAPPDAAATAPEHGACHGEFTVVFVKFRPRGGDRTPPRGRWTRPVIARSITGQSDVFNR